jgi:hypothetical protein
MRKSRMNIADYELRWPDEAEAADRAPAGALNQLAGLSRRAVHGHPFSDPADGASADHSAEDRGFIGE